MKTIWFVYPYGPIVGEKTLEFRYTRFARVLAERGYDVIWWTANFSHALKEKRSKSWETVHVSSNYDIVLVPTSSYKKNISFRRILFELTFSRNLARKFKKIEKPDLIMTSGTGLLSAFRPVWPYMHKKNVPVIYDIMDIHMVDKYISSKYKFFSPFVKVILKLIELREKKFYRSVQGVTGLGRNQLQVAINRTGNRKIPSLLVYNGIYVEKFRSIARQARTEEVIKRSPGWTYCIFAGALGPSYDIITVIEAAEIAKKNNDRIQFIIAGSGPQKEIIEKAALTNDRVLFLGSLSHEDLIKVYSMCDIGLCTYAAFSTVDMPDKFYDYCAAGLAIVNSLEGEIREHIIKSDCGVNYIPGNPTDLYDNLMKISEKDILDNYKKNSYSIAPRFDIECLVDSLINMISSISNSD